jgi:hypothetical protein
MAGIAKRNHQWMRFEHRMDYTAQDPRTLSMDYSNLGKSLTARLFEVVVKKLSYLFGPEGMEVNRIFNRISEHLVFFPVIRAEAFGWKSASKNR